MSEQLKREVIVRFFDTEDDAERNLLVALLEYWEASER